MIIETLLLVVIIWALWPRKKRRARRRQGSVLVRFLLRPWWRLCGWMADRWFPIAKGMSLADVRAAGFYSSPEWRDLRVKALKRDNGRCVACGRNAKDGVRLEVDHIKPRSQFPQRALDLGNLQTLCYDCHKPKGTETFDWREHAKKESRFDWRAFWTFGRS